MKYTSLRMHRVATMLRILFFPFAFFLLPFFFGCAGLERRIYPTPTPEELHHETARLGAVPVEPTARKSATPGSLWPKDDHVFFYADQKARRTGDILTVRIVEAAEASNAADTDLSRKSSISARVDN